MKIGVFALQGAFKEHIERLTALQVDAIEVRTLEDLEDIQGLIFPGGESTAMGRIMDQFQMKSTVINKIKSGLPVWGTCAGLILLSEQVDDNVVHLPVMSIKTKRNAFGRQLGSFTCHERLSFLSEEPFEMVFIRAPIIENIKASVDILHKYKDMIVAAKENNILVTSFHPELTDDLRLHEFFIREMCC